MDRKQLINYIRFGIIFAILMAFLGGDTRIFYSIAGVFVGLRIGLFIVDYWEGRYEITKS